MKYCTFFLATLFAGQVFAADLKIHAINVGWGQAVLIEGPNGTTVMFDSGLPSKRKIVLDYLDTHGITQLDHFFVSHNHSDHGGSASTIAFATRPKRSYFSGSDANMDREFMKNWFAYYSNASTPPPPPAPTAAIPGTKIDLGDGATATVVAANCKVVHQEKVIFKLKKENTTYTFPPCNHTNDQSIVMLVKYKAFDYLVSGDLGGSTNSNQQDFETPVSVALALATEPELRTEPGTIDVLHLGHHGSKTSSNTNYITFAGPKVALVSVGPNQPHGLPNKEAIQPLLDKGVLVLQTDAGLFSEPRAWNKGAILGHITINTDGMQYTISADPTALDTTRQPTVKSDAIRIGLPLTISTH